MASTDPGPWAGLQCRRLTQDNVPAALLLSREAGWNQTSQDWGYMIGHGHSIGLFDDAGNVAATALTLPQKGAALGWVSMVLVTRAWQRHGLATRLLETCVESLLADGRTPGLDATEAGRPVYLPLGFQDVYPVTRMERGSGTNMGIATADNVRTLRSCDLGDLLAGDRTASGCDRMALLSHLHARAPHLAWRHDSGAGHCLGRDGSDATQIGPVVAGNGQAAIDLAGAALSQITGPVFIDVPDHHETMMRWLSSIGFQPQRRFVRMLYGRSRPFDDPAKIYAIAGPELG